MPVVKTLIEVNHHMKRSTWDAWHTHTFGDALLWAAETHADRIAASHGQRSLSFMELAERSLAFASGLMNAGVEPGSKVGLWMSDSLEWLVARWAVPSVGAVLVPLNTRFRDTDLEVVLKNSDTETLIIGEGGGKVNYAEILRQIDHGIDHYERDNWRSEVLPSLKRVIGLSGNTLLPSMTPFEAIETRGRSMLQEAEAIARLQDRMRRVRSTDIAQILYTSGTTSAPKGAQVCHGALLQNNFQTLKRMRLTQLDKYLSCVPLFSATGTGYTLSMLLAGASMIILDRFEPRLFCETVQREGITVGFFVDTIIQDLKAFPDRSKYDLSSLRTGTGAPLSAEAFMFATRELGIPQLIGVYGMSETSNAVARGDCNDPIEKRCGTNGRVVDGVEMRIADIETNVTLGRESIGEICVRGNVLMKGYYKQPDEDRKAFDLQGWFHTGDLGEFDADGFLIYRGRVKEMIKPGGFNVATSEIEQFLKTYPGVQQAVVVGVPDIRLGEVAYAYLEPRSDAAIDISALEAHCRAHIASYKVPRYFKLVRDWPLTASQKIRKVELKKLAAQALQDSELSTPIAPPELEERLKTQALFALLDIRDPCEAERGHIFGMTNLPRNRIEQRISNLVMNLSTPIVVYCDGPSGRGQLAAATLAQLGYTSVSWLQGGLQAWSIHGGELATGTNVPSKKFGERIHHDFQVACINAAALDKAQRQGARLTVVDIRTPEEHRQACIPGAIGISGFNIAMHAHDLARQNGLVVVHCAGRTRGIIAARTLAELGVSNVVALENGTIGWKLAGLDLQYGAQDSEPLPSTESVEFAERNTRALADNQHLTRISAGVLRQMLDQPVTNRYAFDVRSVQAYQGGHIPGSLALPGGQAIQRMDDFIAIKRAPIVLISDGEALASITGVWLHRMGCTDVSILEGGISSWQAAGHLLEKGPVATEPAGFAQACLATKSITPHDLDQLLGTQAVLLLDVDYSFNYRRAHIKQAQWAPRPWLERRIGELASSTSEAIVLTSKDAVQAIFSCATLKSMGYTNVAWLKGGTLGWEAAGFPIEEGGLAHQDDELLPPYRRGEKAMRDYIEWEKLLVRLNHSGSSEITSAKH